MVIDTGGLKKGIVIEFEGALLRVMDYQHIKTARGSATIKITVRNLRTGAITEKSFQNGTRFAVAELERRTVQYLYRDDDNNYWVMPQTDRISGSRRRSVGTKEDQQWHARSTNRSAP